MTRQLAEAASGILRDAHYVLNPVTGLYERATLLEPTRTNALLHSSDLSNAAWTKTNMSVATGIADPKGGSNACTVTATAADGNAVQTLAAGANIVRINSVWIRRRTGTGNVQILDPRSGAWHTKVVTSEWARYSEVAAADTARFAGIRLATNGDAVDVYNFQLEDADFATSDIEITGAAAKTRSVDSFQVALPSQIALPQGPLTFYAKFVEAGTVRTTGARIWQIGASDNSMPHLYVYQSGGPYRMRYETVSGAVESVLSGAPVAGEVCELRGTFSAVAAVQLHQAINGAGETSGNSDGGVALASAWSDDVLWLNSVGSTNVGAVAFLAFKIAKGTRTLAEMRALASMASTVLVLNAGDADQILLQGQIVEQDERLDIGERTRAFAGNLRVSTRSQKRSFRFTTSYLTYAQKLAVETLTANNAIIPCSGIVLQHETIQCSVKVTRATMVRGTPLWELTLSILEV